MLNKRIHKSIIGISKAILPIVLLLFLAPQLIRFNSQLNTANHFFQTHQIHFLTLHGLFYLAIYCCWPKLVMVTVNHLQHEIEDAQIKLALQARYYLLAALVFIELLVCWR